MRNNRRHGNYLNLDLDSLHDAMRDTASAIYIDSPFGLVEMDCDKLWKYLCDYSARQRADCPRMPEMVFRFDRVTADEVVRDFVCGSGRVVRPQGGKQ